MQFCELVLHRFEEDDGHVEGLQRRNDPLDHSAVTVRKGTIMATLIFVAAASVAGIVGTIVLAARDGYRRQPNETFARTV
ncbi:hypothetical protein [Agromyces allii]|nr:hypothetical protein [Agromyces allii]